jgi:nucleoside-diphosphate-sugar epimerase
MVNLACGTQITLLDLLDHLAEIFGRRLEPRFEPARPGDVRHSFADIELARSLLGFAALIDLGEGLAKTVDWYRKKLQT